MKRSRVTGLPLRPRVAFHVRLPREAISAADWTRYRWHDAGPGWWWREAR